MKKRFMCGMLLGLAGIFPVQSHAADLSAQGISPVPVQAVKSILDRLRAGEKSRGRVQGQAQDGKSLIVNVDPYYSASSPIGSVSMKVAVPPYPSVNGDQLIVVLYTVAESIQVWNDTAAGLSAVLTYCAAQGPCDNGHRGNWLLALAQNPDDTEWPAVVVQPGDTVSLDWTGQGPKWSLHATVRQQSAPTHRRVLARTLDTSIGMHFVNTPTFYAESLGSANCDLLPARVSLFDIKIAVPGYDPRQWQIPSNPNQMDCSIDLTMPAESPGKIELTWNPDVAPPTAGGTTRH